MRIRILFIVCCLPLAYEMAAYAGASRGEELSLRFQRKVSCKQAKTIVSKQDIFIPCHESTGDQKSFFVGSYTGNKSLNAVLSLLRLNPEIKSVFIAKEVKSIQ